MANMTIELDIITRLASYRAKPWLGHVVNISPLGVQESAGHGGSTSRLVALV
jgi:hypothetical protein